MTNLAFAALQENFCQATGKVLSNNTDDELKAVASLREQRQVRQGESELRLSMGNREGERLGESETQREQRRKRASLVYDCYRIVSLPHLIPEH